MASGLFVSLCTAQMPSGSVTPYNQPDGTYTDVAGLVNIQCMKAVLAMNTIDATEVKALSDIMSESFWHVVRWNGYYPAFFLNGTGFLAGDSKLWLARHRRWREVRPRCRRTGQSTESDALEAPDCDGGRCLASLHNSRLALALASS